MGRLIDADTVMVYLPFTQLYLNEYLKNVPTVEAIPKADYENRLKADKVAMLTELKTEIEKLEPMYMDMISPRQINEVIQQKINALRGGEDGSN